MENYLAEVVAEEDDSSGEVVKEADALADCGLGVVAGL